MFAAAQLRFGSDITELYIALSLSMPILWLAALRLGGGYDVRFIGTGSGEFRKVLSAIPKQLHRQRTAVRGLLSVVAVGHESAVADLVKELGRDRYTGLTVVGACVAQPSECSEAAGVPVYGGLDDVTTAVKAFGADTVALLSYPEMDGLRLRSLAWELQKSGTDLCVSSALLDVADPRTTIRLTARLTLLHVNHSQLSGARLVVKDLFDPCAAMAALVLLFPLMAPLVDELPQLINVFLGHMSLVGPRRALPYEAERYAAHVRRTLVVKPGITHLWQVNRRSDLS